MMAKKMVLKPAHEVDVEMIAGFVEEIKSSEGSFWSPCEYIGQFCASIKRKVIPEKHLPEVINQLKRIKATAKEIKFLTLRAVVLKHLESLIRHLQYRKIKLAKEGE